MIEDGIIEWSKNCRICFKQILMSKEVLLKIELIVHDIIKAISIQQLRNGKFLNLFKLILRKE